MNDVANQAHTGVARRWIAAYALGIPLAYGALFAAFLFRVGGHDHDQILTFYQLQHWNLSLFGFTRQWSPVMCGGISLAADPHVPFASAGVLGSYLAGPFWGLRAAMVAYFAVGWLGAYLYAGLLSRLPLTRALAASLFIGNGFFFARYAEGHLEIMCFLALPAALWAIHGGDARHGRARGSAWVLRALALGAGMALVVDGSPHAVVHFVPWVIVYAAVLSGVERSLRAIGLVAAALAVVAFADAGYLWPVLQTQQEFPRLTRDVFTNPVQLVWFLLVPTTGALFRNVFLGYEYTLWIGPIVAVALLRSRRAVARALPRSVAVPLAVTAAVFLVLGLGSLVTLGWPRAFSPFDLLRTLPGLRSVKVTARYWGFLALPLGVLGGLAMARFAGEAAAHRWVRVMLACGLVLQLGFQVATIAPSMMTSRRYEAAPIPEGFRARRDTPGENTGVVVEFVEAGTTPQGAVMTPSRGVIDCYNLGDFIRPPMRPGRDLVQQAFLDGRPVNTPMFQGRFLTWSQIVFDRRSEVPRGRWRLVLNQAYNRHWRTSEGQVLRSPEGHLVVEWTTQPEPQGLPQLVFEDEVSTLGARVSLVSWVLLLTVFAVAGTVRLRRSRHGSLAAAPPPDAM